MISKCWKSIPIPKLTRQSKIIIERIININHRNNRANNTKISNNNNNKPIQLLFDIIPQIREDGYFTLNQNYLTKQRGKKDSSGTISKTMENNNNANEDSFMDMDVKSYKCKNGIQNIHLQLFDDQKQSKIYNKESSTSSINNNNINDNVDYPYSSSSSSSSSNNKEEAATSNDNRYKLHLKGYIPYYTNISCKLTNTDIVIKNTHKIEAESKFHISTTNGTIHAYSNITSVSIKLISSNDNSSGSGSGSICFSKLRAQYLYVFIKNGFIKGKLIHGGTSIYMLVKNNNDRIGKHNTDNILDHNDMQSLVNINSIYSSSSSSSSNNELVAPAKVIVISPQLHNIIRIKSNHGHLYLRQHITSISTTASNNTCKDDDKKIVNNDEMEEQQQILNNNNNSIECNSINGSFNIKTYSYVPIDLSPSSILLHIDSLSNKSKSIVQAIDTFTNMNILLNSDINGDTDLKLLSQTSDPDLEDNIIDTLLINDDDDDDAILDNDLFYKRDDDQNNEQQDPLIILPTTNNIKSSSTYALSTKNSVIIPNINYYSGTFTTNTNNNDNNNNSVGKINIQSTSLTALDSFSSSSPTTTSSSSSSNEENNDNVNPIIVAHVHGTIKIDILTWMDKIRNKFF